MDKHTLYRGGRGPSEMRVNVDVFGLWRLLLGMLGEAGRRGAHHPRWWLHLRPHRWRAVRHVRGYEGLKGLLGQRAPVVLERGGSSRTRRVMLLGVQLLMMELMRRRHAGGLLLIGKRWGNREEGKQQDRLSKHISLWGDSGIAAYRHVMTPTSQFNRKRADTII